MDMVRITYENGAQNVLTYRKAGDGRILVSNLFYNELGYYQAHKSFDVLTTLEKHRAEIRAAQDLAEELGMTVTAYDEEEL